MDPESTTGFGSGVQRAIIERGAFAHTHQTLSGVIGFGGAGAVVVNGHRNPGGAPVQGDGCAGLRPGVAGHIGQGFLDDAVKHEFCTIG